MSSLYQIMQDDATTMKTVNLVMKHDWIITFLMDIINHIARNLSNLSQKDCQINC